MHLNPASYSPVIRCTAYDKNCTQIWRHAVVIGSTAYGQNCTQIWRHTVVIGCTDQNRTQIWRHTVVIGCTDYDGNCTHQPALVSSPSVKPRRQQRREFALGEDTWDAVRGVPSTNTCQLLLRPEIQEQDVSSAVLHVCVWYNVSRVCNRMIPCMCMTCAKMQHVHDMCMTCAGHVQDMCMACV